MRVDIVTYAGIFDQKILSGDTPFNPLNFSALILVENRERIDATPRKQNVLFPML
jgi:hypothetical protein